MKTAMCLLFLFVLASLPIPRATAFFGKTFGPILKEGLIGLRQMAYTGECGYTHFKVWAVKP